MTLDFEAAAQGLSASRIRAMQDWGAEYIPYWNELTPEEQTDKWGRHLAEHYGAENNVACGYCHDARTIHPLKVSGKPDYSRIIPCPHCHVWTEQERQKRLVAAGIPRARQAETFENFKNVAGARDAYDACFDLATGKPDFRIVLLYGAHGNGKTHLARAAMAQWLKDNQGQTIRFIRVRDWFVQLKAMMADDLTDAEIERVKATGFLVIDEIGTEDARSDWQAGTLESIINYRYDEQLPTVLTCNLDVKDLAPAIYSRLSDKRECRMCLNKAPDYRPEKQMAQTPEQFR